MNVEEIIAGFCPVLKWLVMKKDSELPWDIRIARWLCLALFAGYVAHCFKEWLIC